MFRRAKKVVDDRGGTDALKKDAQELASVAKGKGSAADKAKAAAGGHQGPRRTRRGTPQEPQVGRTSANFALVLVHGPGWEPSRGVREQRRWTEHAEFMDGLVADGSILLRRPAW